MKKLIESLIKINSGELQCEITKYDKRYIVCEEVSNLVNKYLITEGVSPNFDNMRILADKGFRVFPVEKDSFGWLVGGIMTKKGILTFG